MKQISTLGQLVLARDAGTWMIMSLFVLVTSPQRLTASNDYVEASLHRRNLNVQLVSHDGQTVFVGSHDAMYSLNATSLVIRDEIPIPNGPISIIVQNTFNVSTDGVLFCGNASAHCYIRAVDNITRDMSRRLAIGNGTDKCVAAFLRYKSSVQLLVVRPHSSPREDKSGLFWYNVLTNDITERYFKKDSTFKSLRSVAAIELDPFAYLFSIWRDANGRIQSRVSLRQLNVDDVKAKSVDMRIQCGNYSILRDIVVSRRNLTATFTAVFTTENSDHSAICAFNVSDLQQGFVDNIKSCFSGHEGRPDYFSFDSGCTNDVSEHNYCADTLQQCLDGLNGLGSVAYVMGDICLNLTPTLEKEELLTSVATNAFGSKVIAIFGDEYGRCYKAQVSPIFKEAILLFQHDTPILDIQTSLDGRHIYVLTNTQVFKSLVDSCSSYQSCDGCIKDPMCGWCILENKCSWLTGCRYESLVDNRCPSMSISPRIVSKESNEMEVGLILSHPLVNVSLSCDVQMSGESTLGNSQARIINETFIKCPLNLSRYYASKKGIQNVTISIKGEYSEKYIMTGVITYFNCQYLNSCQVCLDDKFDEKCSWRGYLNKCGFRNRLTNLSISSIQVQISECPVVEGFEASYIMDEHKTLHISSHMDTLITIKGSSFLQPRESMTYACGLIDQPLTVAEYVNSSTLHCQIPKTNRAGRALALVQLYWGNLMVANKATQDIEVYSCDSVVTDDNLCQCASFKYYQPYYQCDICGDGCLETSQLCDKPRKCPKPTIISVFPLSSHINSPILLSIKGTNLGSHFNDTKHAITVAGIACIGVKNAEFLATKKLVCQLPASNMTLEGPVEVKIENQPTVTFTKMFTFAVPEVKKLDPNIGPKSGGTIVTISGNHLDAGRECHVTIGEKSCDIIWRNTSIACKTKAIPTATAQKVSVTFDGSSIVATDVNFTYIDDPEVTGIFPNTSFNSGGRSIRVYGVRLHAIRQPQVFAKFGNSMSRKEICKPTDNETAEFIECPSPPFNRSGRMTRRDVSDRTTGRLGFIMDDVDSVTNLPPQISSLTYYPDPQIYKLDNEKTDYQQVLVIKGHGLTAAATKKDIDIQIGKYSISSIPCLVTTLEPDRIVCNPPEKPPDEKDSDNEYPIKVKIGYLKEYVGYIVYEDDQQHIPYIIGGVIFLVIVLSIVITCTVLIVQHKYRQSLHSQQERMGNKMDKWESAFRMKCREEFAALQTTVSDLTKDLEGGHVLFRDYVTYTTKSMLAWEKDHPILAPCTGISESAIQAMEQFRGLLTKKEFLLVMIHTLEKQTPNFSIKDRSEVAMLLMAILHDNMEYLTSILLTLLNELVDKNIVAQTPKLVMRRSESVGEKLLTHWLSVCMYHELKERSGSALYILYKAIKIQVEKGPLDYITNCAQYSLSEDKLFIASEQDPSVKQITLEVEHVMYTDNTEQHAAVKVLESDTITQSKNKILDIFYNNIPYSTRPAVHSTALEELEADGTSRLFNDEDASSEKDGLWKRLNTLRHYNVKDGAKVRLVISQLDNTFGKDAQLPAAGSPDAFIGSMRKSKRIVRTLSGSNFWHLTKQTQSNQDEVQLSSDVFLPRMLNTKGTLQTYVDDLFKEVLVVDEGTPLTVKFLFDFLDSAAVRCGITDPDVLHTWKCNSLLLRFWVNIIKNPEFVFDIHKPVIVDSCLSVVAQTLMDSCSTADLILGPHSPSNKLLYAKDIPRYKTMVTEFFNSVKAKPAISDQELNSFLTENVSGKFSSGFNRTSALIEMFKYVRKFNKEIMAAMDNCEAETPGSFINLSSKLQGIVYSMDVK